MNYLSDTLANGYEPLAWRADLAVWSFLTAVAGVAVLAAIGIPWYYNKP
ncbi:MAG: hypothetical protein JWM11_7 [Planctomycetaceae bacterium]|nr:hypothetical protein [Planctomycetaceae bacterium]